MIDDVLIWIFFGLPALAIYKNWEIANAVITISMLTLLPWIEHWYAEIVSHYSND